MANVTSVLPLGGFFEEWGWFGVFCVFVLFLN